MKSTGIAVADQGILHGNAQLRPQPKYFPLPLLFFLINGSVIFSESSFLARSLPIEATPLPVSFTCIQRRKKLTEKKCMFSLVEVLGTMFC